MNHNNTVLVTGANGFVGNHLCRALLARGFDVRAAVRRGPDGDELKSAGCEVVSVGDLASDTDWVTALAEVDEVVHLAARPDLTDPDGVPPDGDHRVDVAATMGLAQAAASAGVRRLVFVSSVKVHGEHTSGPNHVFLETDPPAPGEPYGQSKWEAEQVLREIAGNSELELVIVRSPLVYGPGVKGNFLELMRAIDRGRPLPLGAIRNARSLIYVGNLVSALIRCLTHPAACGRTYLVSDGEDLSTPELVRRLAKALGHPARLIPVPAALLRMMGSLTGQRAAVRRLQGSLRVDSARIQHELDWHPPYSLDEGLRATAQAYNRSLEDE